MKKTRELPGETYNAKNNAKCTQARKTTHGLNGQHRYVNRTARGRVNRRLITASSTKSCALDPVPTFLLKEMIDVLLPYVTAMINASLHEGRLPSSQKRAVVTPLLKKPRLDTDELKNYRPVSNLSFVSTLTERAVSGQLVGYLSEHCMMPRLQSAFIALRQHLSRFYQTSSDAARAARSQRGV